LIKFNALIKPAKNYTTGLEGAVAHAQPEIVNYQVELMVLIGSNNSCVA
jgi:hypothetical protein